MKNLIKMIIALFFIAAYAHSESYPKATGYVNDFANLLTIEQGKRLNDKLVSLESKTSVEIAVVTIPSLGKYTIEDYTTGLAQEWAVGKKDKNNGVVFLIAPNERKMRIETASGVHSILTDGKADWIRDNKILPYFRSGNIPQGIISGTEEIIKVFDKDSVKTLVEKPFSNKLEGHNKSNQYQNTSSREEPISIMFILTILGVMGTIIYIIYTLVSCRNIKKSQEYVLNSKQSVAENLTDLNIAANNPFVSNDSKSELELINNRFAEIEQVALESPIVNWHKVSADLRNIASSICFLQEDVKNEIKFVVEAYIRGPKLYDEIPAMIDATSKMIAIGEQSLEAQQYLSEARSEYNKAVRIRSGMTMVDWFKLYLILSSVSSKRERAEYMHRQINSPDYNTESSTRRSGGISTAFGFGGNTGFGGGGGYGRSNGGGGSSGSW